MFDLFNHRSRLVTFLTIFVGGIVIGLLAGAAVVKIMRANEASHPMAQRPTTIPQPVPPTPPTLPAIPPPIIETPTTTPRAHVDATTAVLDVEWTDPVQLDPISVLKPYGYRPFVRDEQLYDKGRVKSGPYQGSKVYVMQFAIPEMTIEHESVPLIVSADGKAVRLLTGMWFGSFTALRYPDDEEPYFIEAPHLTIALSIPPKDLRLANGRTVKQTFSGIASPLCGPAACPGQKTFLKNVSGFTVFVQAHEQDVLDAVQREGHEACFTLFDELGRGYQYSSIISQDTWKDENGYERFGVKNIAWMNGFVSTGTYLASLPGGCGVANCADVMTDQEVGPTSELVKAGTTVEGDPIFVPKHPLEYAEVKNLYETWQAYTSDGKKPTMAAFLRSYPIPLFFWRDAFGRWVRYVTSAVVPAAECGKPVIYLYPERTMSVNVRLPSFVKVTKSEPAYPTQGWKTTAHPDGSLTMSDGTVVGSLFWEGVGVDYKTPKDGFVVANGSVDSFLLKILSLYGLNARESQEFRDFWVPKMTGAPYYRVSFLTDAWSAAAPLSVQPQPRTSIRLFMDWQKLSGPMTIHQPTIVTPKRDGFTLVEWGGTLRK